jgi:class 3 adenylate cyclase
MSTIRDWLASLNLTEYADRFEENRIDLEILPDLTDQDLEKLGVVLGDRRKILRAIRQLSAAAPSSEPLVREDPRLDEAAERRQLSVMFIDLVGSTELSARLDPEDFAEVIGSYHRICASAVTKFEGSVTKYVGDGVLAYFGYPEAHEEDAERAVRAGLHVIDAISAIHPRTGTRGRFDARIVKGLTPFVGRGEEIDLLRRRWDCARDSEGQVAG